jgi:hypothetical protein
VSAAKNVGANKGVRGVESGAAQRMRVFRSLQFVLILLLFGLDFGHGILLGEHDIAFHPMYRLRQTMAVAISRMHNPPARGYLAYKSVVNSFNRDGFAIFDDDEGPQLDENGWSVLFKDTARMDRALRDARDAAVNPSLPPELIRGNELGYADYVYLAFSVFGLHVTSFYYFYFLLLGVSCVLFVLEFRNSPFLLFLLATYLTGLFFLQNYAQSEGDQLASLANSRLFDALSLLPAMHVFLAIWRRLPPRWMTVATVAGQAAILVLLVDARIAALWQIAMILVAGIAVTFARIFARRFSLRDWRTLFLRGGWPCAVTFAFLATHVVLIKVTADPRYAEETGTHLIWHSVLSAILESSPKLKLLYVGSTEHLDNDAIGANAIIKDLNDRHDASSPIAVVDENGHISFDPTRSNAAFDQLARNLTLKVIFHHPFDVLAAFPVKFSQQVEWFTTRGAMAWRNLLSAITLAILAGLVWLGAEGGKMPNRRLSSAAAAIAIVLGCSLMPPLISPSNLSVGTLLCFVISAFVGSFVLVILTGRTTSKALSAAFHRRNLGESNSAPH